jgi:hypothetical protein
MVARRRAYRFSRGYALDPSAPDGTPDALHRNMLNSINAKRLIKENMPVVGPDNDPIAVVDHLEGTDVIKLTKDRDGQHHYIPLTWVDSVDDKVHLDRTADQVLKEWSKTPPIARPTSKNRAAPRPVNSVDATTGQPIVTRVLARKRELEAALAALPAGDVRKRSDIDVALSAINQLLTGDLTNVPPTVSAEMNRWLENNKHLAEQAAAPVVDPASGPVTRPVVDPASGPVIKPVVDPGSAPVRTEPSEPGSTPNR